MAQNLKKLFSSSSILSFLFFTGCMTRQNNAQDIAPYSSNYTSNYKTVVLTQQKIYDKSTLHSPLYYKIQAMQKKQYNIPKHNMNQESTFEKILRQSKQKKLKPKKIKWNSSIEDFPSNVPRGSIQ